MLASLAQVVAHFEQNWHQELEDDAIHRACREAGHTWRDRILGPVLTVRLFLLQILHGNTACNHVPHLAHLDVTGAAYCEARSRVPLEVLQTLLTRATTRMAECVRESGRWLGHRLFILDGSSFSMPDTAELREHFGQSGQQQAGCGFPTAHWLALVHFGSGLFQKVVTAPLRTHDLSQVSQVHPKLESGDVLLGDRGFCSYVHLALLAAQNVWGIFRGHQRIIFDFTPHRPHVHPTKDKHGLKKGVPRSRWIKSLGLNDQLVIWFKPVECPSWLSAAAWAALPEELQVRELRYTVARPGFRVHEVTLVTTLCDAERYPAADLAAAYGLRWSIEVNFRHLKTTMKMDVLRCQTVAGVTKELTMFLLVYNLVRMTMHEAARRQQVSVERISFVDALRWLASARPGDTLPELVVNPHRSGRYEPRVRKRRPKQYPLQSRPRAILREALRTQAVTT